MKDEESHPSNKSSGARSENLFLHLFFKHFLHEQVFPDLDE